MKNYEASRAIEKIENLLSSKNVAYEVINHEPSFTAQRTAKAEHIHGKEGAKVVIVTADGKDVMAVIPAPKKIDLAKMQSLLSARDVRLESEEKFAEIFPDCEVGAMPPFGFFYNVPVYVDQSLATSSQIVFNAGTHTMAIRMKYKDYEAIAMPKVRDISA